MMKVKVVLRVIAHRYYQSKLSNDYYCDYSNNEKVELQEQLQPSDGFYEKIRILLTNTGEYNGECKVIDTQIVEKLTKDNDKCLFLEVTMEMTNPDNYTADKIIKIIKEVNGHYFRSGPVSEYGPKNYYRVTEDYDDDLDPIISQIIKHTKDEYDSYTKEIDTKRIRSRRYSFTWKVENISIDNYEELNLKGTNVCQLKRKCKYHKYYGYLYRDDSIEDLVHSFCLGEANSQDNLSVDELKQWVEKTELCIPIFKGATKYYKITDNNHNLLYEFAY